MSKIIIHNIENNEIVERDMNPDELAQWHLDQDIAKAKTVAAQTAQNERKVLLEKLGITEEEAKLLLS